MITVILVKVLDEEWGDLEALTDREIQDLIKDDLTAFFDGSAIDIQRS